MWSHRHLLGIEHLSTTDIDALLDAAEPWFEQSSFSAREPDHSPDAHAPSTLLRGRTIVNLFFEASTRTRTSFEIAAVRLGASVVNVNPTISSVTKGETLLDTAKNLAAMGVDAFVVRHANAGTAAFIAKHIDHVAVVNAGDGAHEHPTQALLDAFTIRRAKQKLEGLDIAMCGDITHSRVARSNAMLLSKKGARVRLCGPKTMIPPGAEALGENVAVYNHLDKAVEGADVIMMLRIQSERLAGAMMSTPRDYARAFGLNAAMLARAKPDAIVMHPGPINRGVEIQSRVADGPQSVILDQVKAGVAVRMAVLAKLLGVPRAAQPSAVHLPPISATTIPTPSSPAEAHAS